MDSKKKKKNNATGQTVDLAATKLNNLYGGGGNVPRLDSPDKLRRPSKGHVHDSSSGSTVVNNGVTNNGVYSDDGDLLSSQGHHAPSVVVSKGSSRSLRNGGGGTWFGAQSPALSNKSYHFGGSDDGSNAMAGPFSLLRYLSLFVLHTGGFKVCMVQMYIRHLVYYAAC